MKQIILALLILSSAFGYETTEWESKKNGDVRSYSKGTREILIEHKETHTDFTQDGKLGSRWFVIRAKTKEGKEAKGFLGRQEKRH